RNTSSNKHLLRFVVYYTFGIPNNQQEWRNQTVPPDSTTTQIQDLVSNTNYTVLIAGRTGKGVGASTTVYIYIRATLEPELHRNTESVAVISVVSFLVIVTCVVAVLLCLRILRLRNNSPSVFQGNGTCRMVYVNGVKTNTEIRREVLVRMTMALWLTAYSTPVQNEPG
ncbi:hypothetical protein O3P69_015601, partial [Scylla paramamosain]